MAATSNRVTASDTNTQTVSRTKTFTTNIDTSAALDDSAELATDDTETTKRRSRQTQGLQRRSVIAGSGIGFVAVLMFGASAGLSGAGALSNETRQKVFDLRQEIQNLKVQTEQLPTADTVERSLVTALTSALQIADLQNSYRPMTPTVAARGGTLDPNAALLVRRNLMPYFSQGIDQATFEPWFLLASDATVSEGNGLPMSFASGFEWQAQNPYVIEKDSTIRVVWIARQVRVPEGQEPLTYAYAHADYDLVRKIFTSLQVVITNDGQAARQEVREG